MATRTKKTSKRRPTIAIVDRIKKPLPEFAYVTTCIYGKTGTGKTYLLGTMPGRGLVLTVPQIEGTTGPIVLADKADRIDVLDVNRWSELTEIHEYLRFDKHDYAWVAVDTASGFQGLAKRQIGREREVGADPNIFSQQDWGKLGEMNSQFYYDWAGLPMHVLFTAQEQLRESGGVVEILPNISPASLQNLLPAMMVVGRLYTREIENEEGEMVIERRLRVAPSSRTPTKVRHLPGLKDLPPIIADPHLGNILRYLLGKTKKVPRGVVEEATGFVIED